MGSKARRRKVEFAALADSDLENVAGGGGCDGEGSGGNGSAREGATPLLPAFPLRAQLTLQRALRAQRSSRPFSG
jgi:hypothetical protein